jgi:hypothetical protein
LELVGVQAAMVKVRATGRRVRMREVIWGTPLLWCGCLLGGLDVGGSGRTHDLFRVDVETLWWPTLGDETVEGERTG